MSRPTPHVASPPAGYPTGQNCAELGHSYACDGWRMCACGRSLPAHTDAAPDPAGGDGCGMTWRLCGRCDHIDDHHITDHVADGGGAFEGRAA